jgi:tetratricopeptide (TPR) repeat protein
VSLLFRFFPAAAILFVLAVASRATAQEAEESWRDLVTQGQRAAGNNRYTDAEHIFLKAVHEAERFAADDWRVGVTLESLGQVYRAEKKLSEAETAYRRALGIVEKTNGDGSAEVANINFDIANVMRDDGRQTEALVYAHKALSTYEGSFGGTSIETAQVLCLLGGSLRSMKNYTEAEEPLRRCADIRETDGGIDSIELADALYTLALTYVGERKYVLAEPRFKLSETIREHKLGPTSPLLAQTMEDHAALLRIMGRDKDAERLTMLSAAIRRREKKNAR